MTDLDQQCDVCRGESGGRYVGVAAVPGAPISIAWCSETRLALDAVVQIATLALRESGALVTRTFNGLLDTALKAGER